MMDSIELDRFFSHVIKGPDPDDCWFWVGAIADDGYGRFSIRRDGKERMVRPHRHLFEHVTGQPLSSNRMLLHRCDIPLCAHAGAGADSHVFVGTQSGNMLDRAQKNRAGRDALHMRGLSRQQLASRSRALRTALLEYGWDREIIAAVLADVPPGHPALF